MKQVKPQIEYYFLSGNKPLPAHNLADWMLSSGLVAVSTHEASVLLGIPETQVRQRMAALRKSGEVVSPTRGLWVVVPSEYRNNGTPEPMMYIDEMMGHLNVEYCVGWLSAAMLFGASHQAPQVFQVATMRDVSHRSVGATRLDFYTRSYAQAITKKKVTTRSGRAWVASPVATMLMVMADLPLASGIDNAATVVMELCDELGMPKEDDLIREARLFPAVAGRRLGWVLEAYTDCGSFDALASFCQSTCNSESILDSASPRNGKYDARWALVINRELEPDV